MTFFVENNVFNSGPFIALLGCLVGNIKRKTLVCFMAETILCSLL